MWSRLRLTSSAVAVDRDMRIGEPEVDAVELLALVLGVRRELEQRVERDDRLAAGAPLPTTPGQVALCSFG